MNKFTHFVVHHSAGPRSQTVGSIRDFHTKPKPDGKGFSDIAYHYVIDGSGKLHVGREIPKKGAHAPPNSGRIGVCVIGNNTKSGSKWTPDQVRTLQELWLSISTVMPWLKLAGHRDVMSPGYTECPGIDVRAMLLGPTEERG